MKRTAGKRAVAQGAAVALCRFFGLRGRVCSDFAEMPREARLRGFLLRAEGAGWHAPPRQKQPARARIRRIGGDPADDASYEQTGCGNARPA